MNRALVDVVRNLFHRLQIFVLYSRQLKKYQVKLPLKRGLNDMTSLTALLSNWPLVDRIRERADRAGF